MKRADHENSNTTAGVVGIAERGIMNKGVEEKKGIDSLLFLPPTTKQMLLYCFSKAPLSSGLARLESVFSFRFSVGKMSRMEKLQKNLGPIICISIMALDIVAGVLAIKAEKGQPKVRHERKWILFECRGPSKESYNMGLAASILLILGHAIANVLGGCPYIKSKKELNEATANKKFAVGFLVLAWIALAVAFSFLIMGTLENSKSRRSCTMGHIHFLTIGGSLCFIHGLFAVAYYVSAAAEAREEKKRRQPKPPLA